MNKKIWLTGAVCILAIFLTVVVYNNFFREGQAAEPAVPVTEEPVVETANYSQVEADFVLVSEGGPETIEYSNDVFSAVFSADGAVMTSLKLNDFADTDGGAVNLVFSGDSGIYPFSIYNGGFDSGVIGGRFSGRISGDRVIFRGLFTDENGGSFRITKTWTFSPGNYMVDFSVEVEAIDGELLPGDGDYLYSLGFGPQLGPEVERLERGYVYRYFCLEDAGEKRNVGTPEDSMFLELETPFRWLGLESRYFVIAAVPELEAYTPAWDERSSDGLFKRNSFYIQRPNTGTGIVRDEYSVYFGPKDSAVLEEYGLGVLAPQKGAVQILSKAVKAVLKVLNKVIPNYGADIILFALIIQAAIFPISRRTYDNAIRMQLLGPALGELKKKYKYNDAKMSEESQKLFEQNNVRPRSSLAPFIIHLPFFILTYVLLLTDVDFRLAAFIPGWLNDISLPDVLFDIAPLRIPITNWDKIRLLPIIALVLSFIQSRYIQAPAESIQSMRIMSYLLPFVMFVVIYNMPAGAVLYWLTMTAINLLLQWRIKTKYSNA